jgi:uncharacterized protein (DUF302 family)
MHAKAQRQATPELPGTKAAVRADHARSVTLVGTDASTALALAKNAFGREGFGVLAEIDIRETLRTKLDRDIGPYWIIEICNPNLADRALAINRQAGLLMPCTVAVWQEGKNAIVAALRPEVAAGITGDRGLTAIAGEAERHIERALVHLDAPERELPITD